MVADSEVAEFEILANLGGNGDRMLGEDLVDGAHAEGETTVQSDFNGQGMQLAEGAHISRNLVHVHFVELHGQSHVLDERGELERSVD